MSTKLISKLIETCANYIMHESQGKNIVHESWSILHSRGLLKCFLKISEN